MINLIKSLKQDVRFANDILFLAANAPYYLIFKTTNYCWYKCPHCCEKSGPNNEKTYIPQETIFEILTQAKQDPKFINEVVFTGGEIFSAYKFGDKQYIPNILRFAIDNKIGVDIKTNAGWANTSFGKEIFEDLRKVITETRTHELEFPKLQISLSLDNYHTNCFENNMKIIQELAGLPVLIHLSSFVGQEELVAKFEKQLSKKLKTYELVAFGGNSKKSYTGINEQMLYYSSFATLFDGGRAAKIPGAYNTEYPQFTFIQPDGNRLLKLVAFDNFGRVTLGENSGRKIMTPYVDEYKKIKPLPQIFKDLNSAALKEVLYFIYYDRIFNSLSK